MTAVGRARRLPWRRSMINTIYGSAGSCRLRGSIMTHGRRRTGTIDLSIGGPPCQAPAPPNPRTESERRKIIMTNGDGYRNETGERDVIPAGRTWYYCTYRVRIITLWRRLVLRPCPAMILFLWERRAGHTSIIYASYVVRVMTSEG